MMFEGNGDTITVQRSVADGLDEFCHPVPRSGISMTQDLELL